VKEKETFPVGYPQPKKRAEHLATLREWKMALNAHAFVRAHTDLFYETLANGLDDHIPGHDPLWISGDCHGENIGAVGSVHGIASLELNDLDETVLGWAAHDILRLALAMVVAARSRDELRGVESVQIVAAVLEGYCEALGRRSASRAGAVVEAPAALRKLVKRVNEQRRTDLLDKRVPRTDGKRRFALGARYYPITAEERDAVEKLIDRAEVRTLVASMTDDAASAEDVELVDAAFRVAGTGSLGCWRVAALVRTGPKKKKNGDDELLRLVDIKEALPANAIRHPDGNTPSDNAERVVCGARSLVPTFGERMLAQTVLGRRVVVRELLPQDRKVSLQVLTPGEAAPVARALGAVVGRAHARQMTAEAARAWAEELTRGQKGDLPPDWLWEPLIKLVGVHEEAYLRHCAAFAAKHPDVR
jgi:uncharacterized protein (DUF2252 family)